MFEALDKQAHRRRLMDYLGIEGEARRFLDDVWQALCCDKNKFEAFEDLVLYMLREPQTRMDEALEKVGQMAAECHPYTYHFLFLTHAAYWLRKQYAFRGVSEAVYWDIMSDFRYKLHECYANHGVFGISVGWWYKRIFSCDIFMLGRLQYEYALYPFEKAYSIGTVCVERGDPVLSIHIPSAGPLTKASRQDSYRRAFAFFSHDKRPIVCVCDSWLMFPGHETILPETSNIRAFMRDFEIIHSKTDDAPRGSWRIFGPKGQEAPENWPEDTSLQRAYKQHVMNGGSTGSGFGIMIFDGEEIVR
jgi:hypothetical protein